jgi:hypothetical protein
MRRPAAHHRSGSGGALAAALLCVDDVRAAAADSAPLCDDARAATTRALPAPPDAAAVAPKARGDTAAKDAVARVGGTETTAAAPPAADEEEATRAELTAAMLSMLLMFASPYILFACPFVCAWWAWRVRALLAQKCIAARTHVGLLVSASALSFSASASNGTRRASRARADGLARRAAAARLVVL